MMDTTEPTLPPEGTLPEQTPEPSMPELVTSDESVSQTTSVRKPDVLQPPATAVAVQPDIQARMVEALDSPDMKGDCGPEPGHPSIEHRKVNQRKDAEIARRRKSKKIEIK